METLLENMPRIHISAAGPGIVDVRYRGAVCGDVLCELGRSDLWRSQLLGCATIESLADARLSVDLRGPPRQVVAQGLGVYLVRPEQLVAMRQWSDMLAQSHIIRTVWPIHLRQAALDWLLDAQEGHTSRQAHWSPPRRPAKNTPQARGAASLSAGILQL